MELYLKRLGSEKKHFLSPERDKFVIGRNYSCDLVFTSPHISRQHCEILRVPPRGTLIIKNLKSTNTTHVDDMELQNINNFAELRIGSKIGLGVPLSFATEAGIKKANFVFLQLCHVEAKEKTDNEELQQTVEFSSGTHAATSKNDPSLDNTSKQPEQRHGPTQTEKLASGHPAPQPVPFREENQRLQSSHRSHISYSLPPQENSTPHSVPGPQPQNTVARPFSSASQSQHIHQMPSPQHLPPKKPGSMTVSQNRIQEPLSELHLQNKHNEDSHIVDHQKLQNIDVYPNQVESLHTERCGSTSGQSKSSRHSKSNNLSHSGNNSQPESSLAQRHQHLYQTEPDPHKTLNGEDFCRDSIKKQESELEGASETSNQQMSYASNSQNQGGVNKSNSQGGTIHDPGPDSALHRTHQDTSDLHQSHIVHSSAVKEHKQSQQLSNSQHTGITRFDDASIAGSHQSGDIKTLSGFNSSVHGESSSLVPSSCFDQRAHSPLEADTHKTKPSARVAPLQSQFVEMKQSPSSSAKESLVHMSTPVGIDSTHNDLNHLLKDPVSNDLTREETKFMQEKQFDGNSVLTSRTKRKGNGANNCQNESSIVDLVTLQQSRNQKTIEEEHRFSNFDSDDLNSTIRVDLIQPDPGPIEETERGKDDKVRIMRHEEDEGSLSCEEVCLINDCKGNLPSTKLNNVLGKRKRWINEKPNKEVKNNNKKNDEDRKKAWLNDLPVSLNVMPGKDLDSDGEMKMPIQHRKTEKRRRLVIYSDDSSDESLEPDKKVDFETNQVGIMNCEAKEVGVNLNSQSKGNVSSADLKDVLRKRKRIIEEVPIKKVRKDNENSKQDEKKARSNKLSLSLSNRPVKDLDNVGESELPVQQRKPKSKKRLVIESHTDLSEKSSPEPNEEVSETDPNNSLTENHGGLKSTVNDSMFKECRIDVKRLPSDIVSDVMKGKTVLTNEHSELTDNLPVPEIGCNSSEVGAHTSDPKTVIVINDDGDDNYVHDDDDDELPDINIPCIKIESCPPSPPMLSCSRSEKTGKQTNDKAIDKVIGTKVIDKVIGTKVIDKVIVSKEGVDSRGMENNKMKDKKVPVTEKQLKHQNSQNKQDSDTIKSRNQGVNQRKNFDLERDFSCKSKNSDESVLAVEKADAEQGNRSNVSPDVSVKSALLQNVAVKKEKLEETKRGENKVKREKVKECESSGMIIKKEPGDSSEQASNKAVVDDDDNDDVVFMYSQVDETIWVSSDEEETPSQNISFGPMPSSPDLDIEELFREDEEQKLDKDVKNTTSDEDKVVEDDLWFPVLSQSFFSDDDIDFKAKSISDPPVPKSLSDLPDLNAENSRPEFPESLPGPSGINRASENVNERIPPLHKWWPELSQGFSDDDTEVDNALKDSHTHPGSSKSLGAVIEKLKNKNERRVQLTDPKMPPPRKKRGKSCKEFYGADSLKQSEAKSAAEKKKKDVDHEGLLLRNQKHRRKYSRKSIEKPHQKRKDKKSPGLRDNLTFKFNLESYKATVEHMPREKHHLLPKDKKIHSRDRKSRAEENISVQKKSAPEDLQNQKPRTKVIAKVTHNTRSQRLIDVNLFPSPEITLPKLRKPKYKIPKSSDKNEDKKTESPLVDSSAVNTNTVENITSVLPGCDEVMPDSTPSRPSQPVAEEPKTDNNDQGTKGIMKMDMKKDSASKKKVHFPSKLDDLVQALLISPRKNSERAGNLAARAREVLPREIRLQACHIPPNYMEHFIYHICRWNYDWLEAYRAGLQKQEASGKGRVVPPPPVVTSTNYPTLILYNSYDDYREIFSNLMYLEIWENIYQDWVKYRQSNIWLPTEIDVVQPTFVETGTGSLKLWIVKMFTLITHDQSIHGHHPRQGSLISLRIQEGAKKMHVFGHVEHFTKNRKRMVSKELEEACPNGSVCLMMGVQIAKEIIQAVKCGKIIFISNVSYLRPSARTWEGLCKLPLSPLCWDILKPSKDVFSCNGGCSEYLVDGMPLNESQKKAVIEVSNKCIYDQHLPKMSLIHGPPGTGKTRTITALIAQLVKLRHETLSPYFRILLCAPSNAAVDELTLRLLKLREIGTCLRVVRVGVRESINPELKHCTLDALVENQIKMELSTPKNLSTKQEWERRNAMVEQAAEDLQNARKANRNKEVIKQMEIRLTELARSKAEFEKSFRSQPTSQEWHHLQRKWQYQVLINAEVITTTLGGCMSGVMTDVFKIPNIFTCCIIDEAGQCKETETWLPLMLGVRKLVLVGDHRQLPATVLSQLALNKNLKQSLFERLYHRFVIELQLDNMVHTLDVQYRMHPQIAKWPSEHFYMSKLTTDSHIIQQRSCELKPYIVFDLKTSKEQKGQCNELYNPSEAALVHLILEILEPKFKKQKVGVITPYQKQKTYLEEKLARYFGRMNLNVNTIDAFQGQERDIIILSFVRGNSTANIGFLSQRQRLNVALTRARKACFIVANLSSLSGNKDWKSLIKNAESRKLVHVITEKKENDRKYIKSILMK